ncbi:hypothetical protein BDR05DRAFT_309954 [Suillus weaverae]|nr:hypothetical protein BDR05DRAFT_309954 [Suillus weaverae]
MRASHHNIHGHHSQSMRQSAISKWRCIPCPSSSSTPFVVLTIVVVIWSHPTDHPGLSKISRIHEQLEGKL